LDKLPGTVASGWHLPAVGIAHRTHLLVAWAGTTTFDVQLQVEGSEDVLRMKKQKKIETAQQPEPFTPGVTKPMVREHAQRLFDQKLLDHDSLTLDDWVLAERDLIGEFRKTTS